MTSKDDPPPARKHQRPYLGILFECCNAYRHIYKRKDGAAYAGVCPRCGRRVEVPIGPGGTTRRIFRAQ